MNYGKLVKEARESKRISLRRLWKKSGIRDTTISHWENGGIPPVDKLDKVLNALEISLTIGKKNEDISITGTEVRNFMNEEKMIEELKTRISEFQATGFNDDDKKQ